MPNFRLSLICPLLIAACALGAPLLVSCGDPAKASARPAQPFDDWYPADITPPGGTRYPCALTALPREMEGIPGHDHRYINHLYSQILRATQAKLVLLQRMGKPGQATALADYDRETADALAKIRSERVPQGLDAFQQDVLQAIELQRRFFAKATAQLSRELAGSEPGATDRRRRQAWDAVFEIPEGRQASSKLISAWGKMQRRYPDWPEATKDSIYHHLCALDLF